MRRIGLPHLVFALALSLPLIACTANSNADEAEPSADETTAVDAAKVDKPVRVAQGQPIELADHAVEGKLTVFDFMSDYCPPCVQIAPWMDRLHAERDDVVVVKVDVNRPSVRGIDWGSPVLRKYGIRSIPHFKIYGADGELMHDGMAARNQIMQWLQELPPPASGR